MPIPFARRSFLRGAGVAAAGVAVGRPVRVAAAAEPDPSLAPFLHGVASGDPMSDRVVLWTRVTPPDGHDGTPIDVEWVIARDEALTDVVATGTTVAAEDGDWTVKVDPAGLAPHTHHWYAFRALGASSIVGRTRTAPDGPVDRLRFGLVSCSNYEGGYFHAYARLAQRTDLDAILHLGDYVYEYEVGAYGEGPAIDRTHVPEVEMVTLDEYRLRHGQYKLDPDLRALHQLHPFVVTWDDHEITDNAWRDGAANHQPSEGDYGDRRAAAVRAYHEWMPIRTPDPDDLVRVWRTLRYGDLCELIVLDTRLEGRSEQVDVGVLDLLQEAPDAPSNLLEIPELADPDRRLMSDGQWAFLEQRLAESTAQWKVVAQQIMVMPWKAGALPQPPVPVPDFPVLTTGGLAVNTDAWDGYPLEQRRLLAHLRDQDIDGTVVLTGDIHSSWAADLPLDPGNPLTYNPLDGSGSLAVEFVVPSVTSNSFYQALGYDYRTASIAIEQATMLANPHIRYAEGDTHGYCILDITAERVQNQWWHAHFVEDPSATQDDLAAAWETRAGARRLTEATDIAGPIEGAPPAPSRTPPPADAAAPADNEGAAPAPVPTPAPGPTGPTLPATGAGTAAAGAAALGLAAALHLRSRGARPGGADPNVGVDEPSSGRT